MKIAVVGSGISGLMAAYVLSRQHDVHVFEKEATLGGHAHTEEGPDGTPVDTGFIVFNEVNYPLFTRLLRELQVESQPSDMSFGVDDPATGFAFSSRGLTGALARRSNLLRPSFYRFVADIHRFNQAALAALESGAGDDLTLGAFVDQLGLGAAFREQYLVPMSSAIWSAPPGKTLGFSAAVFLRFFKNHGLLSLAPSIRWRTVKGGSRRYVEAIRRRLGDGVHLNAPVQAVRRQDGRACVTLVDGAEQVFDAVVLAAHADQSLALLADATEEERRLLGYYPYQANRVVLHSDAQVMPRAKGAWASWTVRMTPPAAAGGEAQLVMSYDMNRLQSLPPRQPYFVTLNPLSEWALQPHYETVYDHPAYDQRSFQQHAALRGLNAGGPVYFCGAYFGYGFHEDGLRSGLDAAAAMGVEWA
jgi:uncharacterized protein